MATTKLNDFSWWIARLATGITTFALLIIASPAVAEDYFVDPERGDDRANGSKALPVGTLARGLKLVGAGDTLHLASTKIPYRETLEIRNRSGKLGLPIIIDGHGATLSGVDSVDPREWQAIGRGLYSNSAISQKEKLNPFKIDRVFFRIGGSIQKMGRVSKGPQTPLKKPSQLKAGEWTYVAEGDTFYLKIDPEQRLESSGLEFPTRDSGVRISGKCTDLIIRNLKVKHFWNDGFNIHDDCRRLRFENIEAIENGDDGFSAHETCQVEVNGLTARRNSTGVCNANQAKCQISNALISGNFAYDFFGMEGTDFELTNTIIESSHSQRPFVVMGNRKTNEHCNVRLDNVQIVRPPDQKGLFEVAANGRLTATRLTSIGLDWVVEGKLDVRNSILVCDRPGSSIKVQIPTTIVSDTNAIQFARFLSGKQSWDKLGYQRFLDTLGDRTSRMMELDSSEIQNLIDGSKPRGISAGAVLSEMRIPD